MWPGRSEYDSKNVISNLVLLIGIFRSTHDNALRWVPQDLTDDKSTLVQVMAWCRRATGHYMSQSWLSPLSPYGVARPQWVKCRPRPHAAPQLNHHCAWKCLGTQAFRYHDVDNETRPVSSTIIIWGILSFMGEAINAYLACPIYSG